MANNWLGLLFRRFKKGDSLHKAINAENFNKMFNIFEDIKGEGCSIVKTLNGLGWKIVVDGSSSDLEPTNPPSSGGGEHWGDTDPMAQIRADADGAWIADTTGANPVAVSESALVDIDVASDGTISNVYYRTTTIDSNGNVIAISNRTESPKPDVPDEPTDPNAPTCGNPLNDEGEDDSHPFDSGDANEGGGAGSGIDDSNPLDYEGEGGFTPTCNNE